MNIWRSETGSICLVHYLDRYKPQIYPQGSIGTRYGAVRPRKREEFDLDLVCVLSGVMRFGPAKLKQLMGQRLRKNPKWHGRIEEKNRCWRIEYPKQFHLDILVARPAPRAPGSTALEVPDKELRAWSPTDPKGYAKWFRESCLVRVVEGVVVHGEVEPMPAIPGQEYKSPLQVAVQILKRPPGYLSGG